MIQIGIKLDEGAFMPKKVPGTDGVYELRTPEYVTFPGGCAVVGTGVHLVIPNGYCGIIENYFRYPYRKITATGFVSPANIGQVQVTLFQMDRDTLAHFDRGDVIAQIRIVKVPETELVMLDELPQTERGDKGFGSSGR